eukprot:TRINITY_DN14871_c0_g1_i1.p1 TRINITY_DN14871_c0_g1~~TRINITY_DN14871_c0_g1_i1.p1  ORF type:complete len:1032 (+),score=544.91 TRINITY_DN14871_c0_g1_i1:53-3097(+)
MANRSGAAVELTKAVCRRSIGGAEGHVNNEPLNTVANRDVEWTAAKVRQTYIDFFQKKKTSNGEGITFVPSSLSVPTDDPTLLFTNAGMNQYKALFLGTVDPSDPRSKWQGAVNSQKCVRAGGKHNDLDDVGRDTYHHTFFEMLGNWSFGDYFKEESIAWAWELFTEVYKLPKDQLYATYFEGNKELGLEPDTEAKNIWLKYLPEERILPGDMKDNFWEMGDTGPCGPASEIHYDRVGGRNAAHLVNQDDPLVLELWNLVFMTHDRSPDGLKELPAKHVDTGLGLERITSVMQGVFSNYDTDAWWKLFAAIQKETGFAHPYHSEECPEDAVVAYRVVADHIRTITITLTDGGIPDNNGRGYVLRRIIRRAIRFGKEYLHAPVGFFSNLSAAVIENLGEFFTELHGKGNAERVKAIILDEEKTFDKTYENGKKHFEDFLKNAKTDAQKKANGGKVVIAGADAFILHDRFGFPSDLTMIMAEKTGCDSPFVDLKGFDKKMEEQRLNSDSKDTMKMKQFISTNNIDLLRKSSVPATDDSLKFVWEDTTAKVVSIVDKNTDSIVQELEPAKPDPKAKSKKAPTEYMCVLVDRTNFYYESGGQIWDTGVIAAKDGSFKVQVTKVLSMGGYIAHIGQVESGTVKVGAEVDLKVDFARRLDVGANHTGTHELNHSLRHVLEVAKKSHVQVNQKGSSVDPSCMRFDFSWNEKLSSEDIDAVEAMLNKSITAGKKVYDKLVPLKDAMGIHGVRQMFGEKYPDPVRVVSIGADIDTMLADPKNPDWSNYSVEFCGGTHLKTLKDIQHAVVVGEESTMKGIRRMTVLTRGAAEKACKDQEVMQKKLDELLSKPHTPSTIDDKIKSVSVLSKQIGEQTLPITKKNALQQSIDTTIKDLYQEKKQLTQKLKKEAQEKGEAIAAEIKGDVYVEAVSTWGADNNALTELSGAILKVHPNLCMFLAASDAKGKGIAMCFVPKGSGKSAKEWIQAACVKGGGSQERAQTGYKAADEASILEKAKEWIAKSQ